MNWNVADLLQIVIEMAWNLLQELLFGIKHVTGVNHVKVYGYFFKNLLGQSERNFVWFPNQEFIAFWLFQYEKI